MKKLALILAVMLMLGGCNAGQPYYDAAHFGIETLVSPCDADGDGIDDYTDIMQGARADAEAMPRYKSAYYAGGYPPEDEGVCTDLVWRAFRNAGYDLKSLVDADIAENPDRYPRVEKPDPNIDFRRVPNLLAFFEAHAESLTTDLSEISEFQPGDILIVNGTKHIGIVSDRRNKDGVPYFIHNTGQRRREENALPRYKITAHFRFTAPRS